MLTLIYPLPAVNIHFIARDPYNAFVDVLGRDGVGAICNNETLIFEGLPRQDLTSQLLLDGYPRSIEASKGRRVGGLRMPANDQEEKKERKDWSHMSTFRSVEWRRRLRKRVCLNIQKNEFAGEPPDL